MAYVGLSRISVCVLDEGGLLQIRGEDGHYSGILPRVPTALSVGDSAHIRMSVPMGERAVESVDVLGTIELLEGGPGPVPLSDGLIFELSVSHVSRHAANGAPPPALPSEEALEEEPLESPIHFSVPQPPGEVAEAPPQRTVDVERREVSYDPAALYAPVPLSTPDGPVVEDESLELDEEELRAAAERRARALRERFVEEVERPAARASAVVEDDEHSYLDHEDDEALAQADVEEDEDATVHHRSGSRQSARAVYEATEPSGVVGTLREMSLTEVVQSLGFSGKTAAVDVRPKGVDLPPGVVFLDRGNVVYARCGTLEGEEAFFALADLKRGAFLIRFHAQPPTTNVNSPTAFLLLEALRRKDEENHERDLVEAVAEEVAEEVAAQEAAAALDAPTSDGLDDADQTLLSGTLSLDDEAGIDADGDEDEPAEELVASAPAEVELDDEAIEEALVAEEPAIAAAPEDDEDDDEEPRRPYATATPTTIFSRFFEEASEDDEPAASEEGEGDDFADPTFSGLKAALKGLKGGEDDTLALFDHPMRSGSFPSYS